MKTRFWIVAIALILGLAANSSSVARAADENPLEGFKLSGEAFLNWSYKNGQGATSNAITLERGYFTVTKKANSWLSFRYTTDVAFAETKETAEGTVENTLDGNYVIRTRILMAEMSVGGKGALTDVKARFGMQGVGPDDFEQAVNPYRAQSRNWLERIGLLSTADIGLGLAGSFGGKLEDAQGKTGSAKFDGRYGTWQLNLTNGGGYAKKEANENKLLSGRVTVRPLADRLPGLQLTYAGAVGRDNTVNGAEDAGVDFSFHYGMLSWQSPQFVVYAQSILGENNQAGKFVYTNDDGESEGLRSRSWSLFGAAKLPAAGSRFAVFARYSVFDGDADDDLTTEDQKTGITLMTGGVSYDIAKGNLLIAAIESTDYDEYADELTKAPSASARNRGDDTHIQLVYRMVF